MTHNFKVEMQGKCRRLFYALSDGPPKNDENGDPIPGMVQYKAGDVLAVASGGGALEELTGDDLIVATFNDHTAPQRIGCIEEFFSPVPATKPLRVDLTLVRGCCDAVDAHRAAVKAEKDYVFETSIRMFSAAMPKPQFVQQLTVQEIHTRGEERATDHRAILDATAVLRGLGEACDACCEQLLVTRDAAITFADVS